MSESQMNGLFVVICSLINSKKLREISSVIRVPSNREVMVYSWMFLYFLIAGKLNLGEMQDTITSINPTSNGISTPLNPYDPARISGGELHLTSTDRALPDVMTTLLIVSRPSLAEEIPDAGGISRSSCVPLECQSVKNQGLRQIRSHIVCADAYLGMTSMTAFLLRKVVGPLLLQPTIVLYKSEREWRLATLVYIGIYR